VIFVVHRFKNGKELKPNKRYKMSYEGDVASLTVVAAEESDQGSYLCKASNKLGTVDTECTLTIQGGTESCHHVYRVFCVPTGP